MPFSIYRTPLAQGPLVQEIRSGAVTFGHRFLTTSGRAGRAIKVKGFDDYRKRLAENFVVLERTERQERIARELEGEARRRGGRVSRQAGGQTLLQEVPDLVEYPKVDLRHVRRRVPLPSRGSADDDDDSPSALLSDRERSGQAAAGVSRRPQHGGGPTGAHRAQPRARADRAAARRAVLLRLPTASSRSSGASTGWARAFPQEAGQLRREGASASALLPARSRATCSQALTPSKRRGVAGRLAKADLATDMVREMTELQGTMGGIYAREDGHPEEVWKAIYYHYLPRRRRSRRAADAKTNWAAAATTWAAVSLADKLDTVVGMFAAGERPTGSRDPYGLRRAAQGLVRTAGGPAGADRPRSARDAGRARRHGHRRLSLRQKLVGSPASSTFCSSACDTCSSSAASTCATCARSPPVHPRDISPLQARRKVEVLPEFTESPDFKQLAMLFKRVRNIARNLSGGSGSLHRQRRSIAPDRAGGSGAAGRDRSSASRRSTPP